MRIRNIKSIFLCLTLLVLVLAATGVSAAEDTNTNGTAINTQTISPISSDSISTDTLMQDTNEKIDIKNIKNSDTTQITDENTKDDKLDDTTTSTTNNTKNILKNTQSSTTKKDAEETVTTYTALHNALTSTTGSLTITLGSNITLEGSTTLNTGITSLTIDGAGYSINGQNNYQFLQITHDISNITIKNTIITNCKAQDGGAIQYSGTVTNAIYTNNTITNNNASSKGAINYLYDANNITYTGNTFTNNTAADAGVIYYSRAANIITYTGNTFTNNTAKNNGGAIIYDNLANIITYNSNTFTGNIAKNNGGAIIYRYAGNNTYNNNSFTDNTAKASGGAIYYRSDASNNIYTGNTFNNNTASSIGGAIRYHSAANNTYNNNTFTNNTAVDAGVIYYSNGASNNTYTGNAFTNNTAEYGGAIRYRSGASNNTYTGNTFTNNIAEYGGVIYYSSDVSNNIFTGNAFTNNTSNYSGGALYYNITASNNIYTGNAFTKNTASNTGGVIYYHSAASNNTYTGNTFNNNTGNSSSGAIYYHSAASNNTYKDNTFNNNIAEYGGAISYNKATNNNTYKDNTFNNNTATTGNGGAIFYWGAAQDNMYMNNTFNNNTATTGNGGAISYSRTTKNNMYISNTFNNNTANSSGGAIYNNQGTLTFTGNVFVDNHAGNKETIDLYDESSGEFSGNTYEYTDINLTEIKLSIKDDKDTFNYGEDVILNYSMQLANPDSYKDFEDGINDITLYINDEKNITTKYENTSLSNLKPGEYTVYFSSCNQQSNTVTFDIVGKLDVNITYDPIADVAYCDNVTITGNFTDKNGKTISNSNINVYINGKQHNAITDKTGTFKLIAPVKVLGTNNVTLSYGGNAYYNSFETNTTFNAGKQDLIIVCDSIVDVAYGDNVTITGKFTDKNGKVITKSNVNVYVSGKQYKARTDSNGAFKLIAPVKVLGTNNVTLSYGGNAYYNSFETNTTFNAGKQDLIITCDPIADVAYGDNVTITGKFTDKNGKAITKSNVNVIINGKQYKAKTDSTGAFVLIAPVKAVGINNVTLSYGGNSKYNSYETSTTFNAGKQDLIITCDPIADVAYGDNVTITGKFTDKNGKAITKSNVNVIINGKQYKAKTDSTGAFTLTAPVKAWGTNNVTLSYGGNTYYNSFETTTTFNAGKQDIVIKYNPIQDTVCGDNVTITGKFTDKNGKAITNSNVNVNINGKQYKARTDSTGAFTLSVETKVVGTNNVTFSYGGNACYNSFETSTTFNVIAKAD